MHLDKGQAIDAIFHLLNLGKEQKVLYLGDSENDNPAFQKAESLIGIRSDERLKTKLDSRLPDPVQRVNNILTETLRRRFRF